MKYAGVVKNDVVNCPGIGVSVYLQGCSIHCIGCHNSSIWDFDGGKEFNFNTLMEIEDALTANGITRSLCILGGEPFAEENVFTTAFLVEHIKLHMPQIKIYLWSGYTLEELYARENSQINYVLNTIDYLIDGPFDISKRDVSLFMRGSTNQRIIDMKTNQIIDFPENLCYNNIKRREN